MTFGITFGSVLELFWRSVDHLCHPGSWEGVEISSIFERFSGWGPESTFAKIWGLKVVWGARTAYHLTAVTDLRPLNGYSPRSHYQTGEQLGKVIRD